MTEYDFIDNQNPPGKWDAVGPYRDTDIHPGDVSWQSWFMSLEDHFKVAAKGNPFIDTAGLSRGQIDAVRAAAISLQEKYKHLGKVFEIIED